VEAYFRRPNLDGGNIALKRVNNKKYYKITGEGLKHLSLMMNNPVGKRTRQYFLKIEQLAGDMLRDRDREQAKAIAEQALAITELREKCQTLTVTNSAVDDRVIAVYNEFIARMDADYGTLYLATNYTYGRKGQFKIGSTAEIKGRMASLNTGHTFSDSLIVV
jgi:phage anti-repressor protein